MRGFVRACLLALLSASAARGQAVGTDAVPHFDVVSIHQNNGASENGLVDNGAGKLHVVNCNLKVLIEEAYDLRSFQVSGGAGWVETLRFDIEARSEQPGGAAVGTKRNDNSLAAREERNRVSRLQLQALLADRFHLRVQQASKVTGVFLLMPAKTGVRLQPVPKEVGVGSFLPGKVEMKGVTLALFSRALSQAAGLDRVVIDRTGLTGFYDISLHWDAGLANAPESDLPQLSTAMGEQLGLQLQAQKESLPFVVIEDAEKPSPN